MSNTRQYQLHGNELILTVKKAPLFIRSAMFLVAFLLFILPLTALTVGIILGSGLHIAYLIFIFLFGIMGFYLLRIALWNTYGKEVIQFSGDKINYIADYGWFKDGKKQLEYNNLLEYGVRSLGYQEDNEGALIISNDVDVINCVTKMHNVELADLLDKLKLMEHHKINSA